ncbi:MAG: SIS domain-containing protein [Desulfovermiculus sp.]|nr:SIS domain-containing protein [Desulfovermiculus sp.]
MCGIVVYCGQAENPLTRILTGMWSIIYRAPDSTGVGVFGDELEPIRTRKAVGSVVDLVQSLNANPLTVRTGAELVSAFLSPEAGPEGILDGQRRLLQFEGLPLDHFQDCLQGQKEPPTWSELQDSGQGLGIQPGMPGRPRAGQEMTISSARDLREIIHTCIVEFDLPPLVVKSFLAHAIQDTLDVMAAEGSLPLPVPRVLDELDRVFEGLVDKGRPPRPLREDPDVWGKSSYARPYLWRALVRTPFRLPADYDRDGVRHLFWLMDALVMARAGRDGRLNETIQNVFSQKGTGQNLSGLHWQSLYRAERTLNVYGLAAASVYTHLQEEQTLSWGRQAPPWSGAPWGQTHPLLLQAMSQPVLAHGRWAIQSQVTLNNTHPFVDQEGVRCACVNGQFSSEVESRVRHFLTRVANIRLRSENSTEYFAQLWGLYAKVFSREQSRYEAIRQQVSLGLEDLAVGSQAIDHQVYKRLQGASAEDIEDLAFVQAMRIMIRDGGQVAVAGMSLVSPHRIFAASHNRPVFVVRRPDTDEFMLVSDVNAALGLFPQSMIQEEAGKLHRLMDDQAQASLVTRPSGSSRSWSQKEQEEILSRFQVRVIALQGEELLARIQTRWQGAQPWREVTVTDLDGQEQGDVETFNTRLSPVQIKRNLNQTFYETHVQEIPNRLQEILGAYLPAGNDPDITRFPVRMRLLRRRFGQELKSLRRVFLVGMGSSYHVAAMAKSLIQELAPNLPVVVQSAVEIENVGKSLNADRDLLIFLSWSGTTSDMVQLAKDVRNHHITAVGVTEKPFADLGLVLRKSGGVIPAMSGEEVTVSGVKSLLCMLMSLELLALALLNELGYGRKAAAVGRRLHDVPKMMGEMLEEGSYRRWSKRQCAAFRDSLCHVIIDAQHSVGSGTEMALKLEENSWTSMGKTFDFRDVEPHVFDAWSDDNLIVVNATNRARLQEALFCMRNLQAKGVPFVCTTFEHESLDAVREACGSRVVVLPKADDLVQPFVDLFFYLQFGLDYGLAHGRQPGEFPRNRAKSVTASRSRPQSMPGPAREMAALKAVNDAWLAHKAEPGSHNELSAWEQARVREWEGHIYRDLRTLSRILAGPDPLARLMVRPDQAVQDLAEMLWEQLAVDGEMVFMPLDKAADATARTVAKQWSSLLACPIRVDSPGASLRVPGEDSLIVFLASQEPEDYVLDGFLPDVSTNCLWIGPQLRDRFTRAFEQVGGYAPLRDPGLYCLQDVLYAALSLFFIQIWEQKAPDKARILRQHFSLAELVVHAILEDKTLHRDVVQAFRDNQEYMTALFIGPATGNGLAWVQRFDQHGGKILEWYPFGASSHGPLVTVDNRVQDKFVPLAGREEMLAAYGQEQVQRWEKDYFDAQLLPEVWSDTKSVVKTGPVSAFFAQGQWFLPELKPGYDCRQDNLILIDACSTRAFGQALDELATFGCRFARMTVISQAAFARQGKLAGFNPHPISHLLLLPDLGAPVSQYLLPFAHTLLSTAMAAQSSIQLCLRQI